jgi:hypothetical protein
MMIFFHHFPFTFPISLVFNIEHRTLNLERHFYSPFTLHDSLILTLNSLCPPLARSRENFREASVRQPARRMPGNAGWRKAPEVEILKSIYWIPAKRIPE